MSSIRVALLLVFAILPLIVLSQNDRYRFHHLTSNDGLSHSDVTCVFQDSRGFMWFGTRDGLNKYDGYNFITYKKGDSNKSISSNHIKDIIEDSSGNLWIATLGGGLNMFDRQKEIFVRYIPDSRDPKSITSFLLNTLEEDSEGNIWIGTDDVGVSVFNRKENEFLHFPAGFNETTLSGNTILCIFEDTEKRIWIGTDSQGLNLYNRD